MPGIKFHKTRHLKKIKKFYIEKIGMKEWLNQEDCTILKHGNLLLGFCKREEADGSGIITFFYRKRENVDKMYERLKDISTTSPELNGKYNIYQFFAEDPEGRTLEFQHFLQPVDFMLSATEVLKKRRSVRNYTKKTVDRDTLEKIFEICRFSPTSMNSESYYFLVIENPTILEQLSRIRGKSSKPISEAPMAVAICTDTGKTKRPEQDGCIASYHFMLAARTFGLGTCWIADMDREAVKEELNIPRDHYIATITPLGYPSRTPETPERRGVKEMINFFDDEK